MTTESQESSTQSHDEIYRDMTAALKGKLVCPFTPRAEQGLRDFIREAVIHGVDNLPERYEVFREYLKCRFEHIGRALDEAAEPTKKVKWREIVDAGPAEVPKQRKDCDLLIKVRPAAKRDAYRRRICKDYDGENIKEPTHLEET